MNAPKLLNPGPVTLTPRVRSALSRPDLCHREPEFAALQRDIRTRLSLVYGETASTHDAVLITGSGTAAVECMVGSLVPRGGRAAVLVNGLYGERIAAMLEAQHKTARVVRSPFGAPMNVMALAQLLDHEPEVTHVIAVHHETTTGRLNDMTAMGAVCRTRRLPLLLDTVSSFGGESLEFEAWNLAAVAGVANKCLHGAPGVGFVLARKSVFAAGASGATSLYLDLFRHHAEQMQDSTAFTQAVPACQALHEALCELEESGGWRRRHARYRELSAGVFEGLQALGVPPFLPIDAPSSAVLTAYRLPPGCDYPSLHDALKRAGFIIYAGQSGLGAEIFRIAVMGDLARTDIDRLLGAFRAHLGAAGRQRVALPVGAQGGGA